MMSVNVIKSTLPTRQLALLVAAIVGPCGAHAEPASGRDLTSIPFEQLLAMEVYSASKFVQPARQAPASVTVITAGEIRDFGWRTLADVARSVRGQYVSYDRNYSYLGARGFLRPGDYNTRFLLQVNGNRINDGVYDQAPLGNEFPLDLELVERIEFVPGPGSSIYGSNAFFGVINVITKQGADLRGTRVGLEAGGAGWRRGSASVGWDDGHDTNYLLAASRYRSAGKDLYYPEFDTPQQNHGVAQGLDYERGTRLFASATHGAFSASVMHAERTKGIPTASFGQIFNDPRPNTVDRQSYLNAAWHSPAGASETVTLRGFAGHYDSIGDYVSADPGYIVNHDGSRARWWGAEVNLVSTRFKGHTLLAGADIQRDFRLQQFAYDVAPYRLYLDSTGHGYRGGLYFQDDMGLSEALRVSLGLRYDHSSMMRGLFSPRAAVIYSVTPDTTIRAIQGSAFRAPNSYEMYYAFPGPGGQRTNPDLRREHIASSELALVQRIGANARLTVTAFRNSVSGLITLERDADTGMTGFDNAARLKARGMEIEYERSWANGAALRSSFSHSHVGPDPTGQQINAPARLAKFNLAAPLPLAGLRGAIEAQYVGPRHTQYGAAGAFWLVNANLLSTRLFEGAEASLAVTNLFGRRYADPGSAEHVQSAIVQDGRRLRARVAYGF